MQLKLVFRGLVLGEWLVPLVGTPAVYTRFFTPDAAQDAPALPSGTWLIVLYGITISIAAVVASIGLWRFRRWGRTLFVAVQIVSLAFGLLAPLLRWLPMKPTTPFPTAPLDWLVGPMTGAIIALAYASPIAAEFGRVRDARGIADNPAVGATSG